MDRIKAFIKTSIIGGLAVILPAAVLILIFHLPGKFVHPVGVSVEETMRSVIGCGAGSARLLNALDRQAIVP